MHNDESLTAVALAHNEQLENQRERQYPVTEDWLSSDKPLDGGDVVVVEWSVERHSTPYRLQTGYERYTDTIVPTLLPGTQTPAFTVQPVMISLKDETVYSGKGKVVGVVEERTENVRLHMDESIQQFVMRGAAASGSWGGLPAYIDWPTLNGIDNTTGFLEAVATGTNTVHGKSKATYPATTHPGFHNLYADSAGAAGTNLLNDMYGMAIEYNLRGLGMLGPANSWYIGAAPAKHLKRALRPLEQYVDDKGLDDGRRMALSFAGGKIVPIADMPTNGASSAASPMSVVLTNWKRGIYARLYPDWKRKMRAFVEIPGTVGVRAALFLLGGTMVAPRAGLWGVVENAEAY